MMTVFSSDEEEGREDDKETERVEERENEGERVDDKNINDRW